MLDHLTHAIKDIHLAYISLNVDIKKVKRLNWNPVSPTLGSLAHAFDGILE